MNAETSTPTTETTIPPPEVSEIAAGALEDAAADLEGEGMKVTRKLKSERVAKDDQPPATRVSKVLQEVQRQDDLNLRDYLQTLGAGESVRLDVVRKEPKTWTDPETGKVHNTGGFCGNFNEFIGEETIREHYGGGVYTVRVNRPNEKGSMIFFKARDVRIQGDPKPPPSAIAKPQPPQSDSMAEGMVKQAFDVLKEQTKSKPAGLDPAIQLLLDQQKADNERREKQHERELARRDQELADLKAMIRDQGKLPTADAFKDQMLGRLMDNESAQIAAIRTQHMSELNQIKEGNRQDLERITDRHEREVARLEKTHDREVTQLVENHKREMDMLRMSKDNELTTHKTSADTQKQIFQAENNRLTKENDRLSDEVKELRAKKDKSVIEMVKEMKTIKDAVVGDEEKEDEGIAGKIMENAPAIIDQVGQAIARATGKAQQPAQPQPQRPPAQSQRRVVKDEQGNTFIQHNNRLVPVRKQGQQVAIPAADGQSMQNVEIPQIDPQKIEFAVNYLERAFSSDTDPDTVAISIRPHIPEEILQAISTLGGIDQFMIRVAKLPGSSPLASQAGKNWVRKVGKALVGE